jgi:hypothetical protein
MSFAGLALATVASLAAVQPTPTGLHHKFDCEKVLQLRPGQSKAQAVALLGEPWFEADQRTMWSNGRPRQDWIPVYGSNGAPARILRGAVASFAVTSRAQSSAGDPASRVRDLRAAVGAAPGRYAGVSQEYQGPPAAGLLAEIDARSSVEIQADGTLAILDGSSPPKTMPWVEDRWKMTVKGRVVEAWARRVGRMLVIDMFAVEDGKVLGGGRWYLVGVDSY